MVSNAARLVRVHLGPLTVAIAIAIVYFALDLRGGDLAAHLFRAELFEREGLLVWNYNWYGGHYVVSYGFLFPGLAATVGVRLAGMLTYLAAVLLFSVLAHRVWPKRGADAAAYVFAVSFSAALVIGQLPFALGIAVGLGALLLAADGRAFWAAVLVVNCAFASPLAALFVAFVAAVIWLPERRPAFLVVAGGAVLPALVLSIAFPEGGTQPFHFASYAGAMFATGFFWFAVKDELAPPAREIVKTGVLLYLVFLTASELIPSPVGGNSIRLGMLAFAPLMAAVLWPRAGRYALALIIPAFGWQAGPAVWAVLTEDRSTSPQYFAPVNEWLDQQDRTRRERVNVVFTRNHFEAAYVADKRPITRGWERQLDTKYNALFYDGELTSARYAAWLAENEVRWVALSNATPDYSARDEIELIERRPRYLRLAAHLRDWRIFRVDLPRTLEADAFPVDRRRRDRFEVRPARYGVTLTTVRWQRFWRPSAGCIARSPKGLMEIELPRPPVVGAPAADPPPPVTIATDYSLGRLFGAGRSCARFGAGETDATGAPAGRAPALVSPSRPSAPVTPPVVTPPVAPPVTPPATPLVTPPVTAPPAAHHTAAARGGKS